jgi:hypothetical protein
METLVDHHPLVGIMVLMEAVPEIVLLLTVGHPLVETHLLLTEDQVLQVAEVEVMDVPHHLLVEVLWEDLQVVVDQALQVEVVAEGLLLADHLLHLQEVVEEEINITSA